MSILDILPKLPIEKQPKENNRTEERRLISKIIQKQPLSLSENETLNRIFEFYEKLNSATTNLDYSKLSGTDIKKLRTYINQVYYYTLTSQCQIQIKKLYRIVINKSILGNNDSITKVGHLSYPPAHIVNKINKFNRANSSESTVFYGAQNIETAIFELKPEIGSKVTIGEWSSINEEFYNIHIIYHNKMYQNDEDAPVAFSKKHNEFLQNSNENIRNFFEQYYAMLGREFSKPVNDHREYIISATLSDKLFANSKLSNSNLDGIMYPSVNNGFSTNNIVLDKKTLRHKFHLTQATEFEITKTYYDSVWNTEPGIKTIIEGKNKNETTNIHGNRIHW